jgi:hypothetical protein
MEDHNSLCGSVDFVHYCRIFETSLSDVASSSAYPKREYLRDIDEFRHRASREGMGFLTKTLPSIAKAIDKALATGTKLLIPRLEKRRSSEIPKFLGFLVSLIFDDSGRERSDASPWGLGALRQLLYLFYKLEIPSTEKQNNEVIDKFVDTDRMLDYSSSSLDSRGSFILSYARNLVARILSTVDPLAEVEPRHGPGAVATGEKGPGKVIFKRFYHALSMVFPYEDHFFWSPTHLCDSLDQYLALEELPSGTARVVLVPKDSRGPRLISCEPLEYQWIQQGLMKTIVRTIESHPLSQGQVNFSDQTVNRQLAMLGSQGEPWVTLDMKDASDRVSVNLVRDLFPERWFTALMGCRSSATELPDGAILPLKKFAPMGSAVCFPVEALSFWALSVATLKYTYPMMQLAKLAASVYVYGDDIICDGKDQSVIRQTLPLFGLMFNDEKCCTAGFFRESCGCDAYKGVDVTPLRLKRVWDRHLAGTSYASWVSFANSLLARGYVNAGDYVIGEIQNIRPTPYTDSERTGFIAFYDVRKTARVANRRFKRRYNMRTCRSQIYATRVRTRVVNDTSAPGWSELLRVAAMNGRLKNDHSRSGSSLTNDGLNSVYNLDPTLIRWALGISEPVTAYQYTLPRQGSLRRGWCDVI